MSNSNYTKVSNSMVAKYGLKVAYVYAKLHYRMNLSHKNNHFKDDHGHYIVYKINDLANDCHMSRGTVIRSLKKLEKDGLISKDHTMFCNHIYLPKFNCEINDSSKMDKQSSNSELSREHNTYNQELDNNYVYCSTRSTVKKAHQRYPSVTKMIKRFGKQLFDYAVDKYHDENRRHKINNTSHYIYGILRRWQRKGIKTVNKAMESEDDNRAMWYSDNHGPEIPIFKIR